MSEDSIRREISMIWQRLTDLEDRICQADAEGMCQNSECWKDGCVTGDPDAPQYCGIRERFLYAAAVLEGVAADAKPEDASDLLRVAGLLRLNAAHTTNDGGKDA